jgi:hypothetical protein
MMRRILTSSAVLAATALLTVLFRRVAAEMR